ncbi:IS66 family insertion sequence element accessory protein TnpA [Pedobacter sp. JCM 36344]
MFAHIESWKSSRLSQPAFCKQYQLKPPTFIIG